MRQFHHFGIPTKAVHENETYLEEAKLYITDAGASPNSIEWLRFEPESGMPELLQTVPHIAYKVDDLTKEMEGRETLLEPFRPLEGVTAAFVIEEGAPIELMQFDDE